jgi:hypothetical protein
LHEQSRFVIPVFRDGDERAEDFQRFLRLARLPQFKCVVYGVHIHGHTSSESAQAALLSAIRRADLSILRVSAHFIRLKAQNTP